MDFKTKIGEKNISSPRLGVMEGERLRGRVSLVLAQGIKSATGHTIGEFFRDEALPKAENGASGDSSENTLLQLFNRGASFRIGVDWEGLLELIKDCCEQCTLTTKDYSEPLKIDDLDFYNEEHVKLFAWYVESHLGNFTAWKKVKPLLMKGLIGFLQDAVKDFKA